MVSRMVTIVRASRHHESRSSTHHLVVWDANLTMMKSRSVGACASSLVQSPSLSPLLVRSSRARILMCIVVRETCASHVQRGDVPPPAVGSIWVGRANFWLLTWGGRRARRNLILSFQSLISPNLMPIVLLNIQISRASSYGC
jgi:hypothetical protein